MCSCPGAACFPGEPGRGAQLMGAQRHHPCAGCSGYCRPSLPHGVPSGLLKVGSAASSSFAHPPPPAWLSPCFSAPWQGQQPDRSPGLGGILGGAAKDAPTCVAFASSWEVPRLPGVPGVLLIHPWSLGDHEPGHVVSAVPQGGYTGNLCFLGISFWFPVSECGVLHPEHRDGHLQEYFLSR